MNRLCRFLVLAFTAGQIFNPTSVDAAKIRHMATISTDQNGEQMVHPTGIACGGDTMLVADSGNGRLLSGLIEPDRDPQLKEVKIQAIQAPLAAIRLSDGHFLVLDAKTGKIGRIDGATLSFAGFFELNQAPAADQSVIKSMATDGNDQVYLLDIFKQRILVLDANGNFQRQLELPGEAGFISDVTVTESGLVYVVDSVGNQVYAAAPEAETFESIGIPDAAAVDFLAAATTAETSLMLIDRHQGQVVLVGFDGSLLEYKFGEGYGDGQFRFPSDICLDKFNRLFVADQGNNRIQIFETEF